MIKKVKYDDINFAQYAECLDNACQNADYADKQFLDIVSDRQWFLLVYGDYEAVMPVSYVRKFGLTFILMPKICQYLGVFSKEDNSIINELFYDFLKNNFLVLSYTFNGDNQFDFHVQKKTSYLLKKDSYPNIKKRYSSHRRRNVRITGDLVGNLSLKKELKKEDEEFFFKNVKGIHSKQEESYFNLFSKLFEENIIQIRVLEFKNKIQSFVYIYEGKYTRYLSFFINGYPLENPNFPSIMIDFCLQEFIEDKNFDFMGSEVESIAKFNERFGAAYYQYPIIINSKINLIKNLFNRLLFNKRTRINKNIKV